MTENIRIVFIQSESWFECVAVDETYESWLWETKIDAMKDFKEENK